MARKKEKVETPEIKASLTPVSPVTANMVALFSSENVLMIDFGFVAPSYKKPYELEDNQIARICLTWNAADGLSELLIDAISEHKKGETRTTKRNK